MQLSCAAADGSTTNFPLQALTRIGRAEDNDIQIFDPAASSHHCEVRISNGSAIVRDLGSTNGILVDGSPVQEVVLRDGSVLRVGGVEFVFQNAAPALNIPVPPPVPALDTASYAAQARCRNHPGVAGEWRCSKCGAVFCGDCIVDGRKFGVPRVKFCALCSSKAENLKATQIEKQRREKSFGAEAIAAWKYPLRGDGLVILIAGTIFLALSNIFQRVTFLFSGLAFVATTGYLLAYSQKIITSTANGEDDPPTWPDLSDFSQDILTPFFQAIGMFVLYLLPWFCSLWLLPAGEPVQWIVSGLLLLLALFLMPMAWLAVSMHDTIGALSPHLVFPSILRIPLSYLAVSLELIVLIAVNTAVSWGLDQLNIPVVPWLAGSFLGLYFFMVIARLLGVLYYTNREKLGWF